MKTRSISLRAFPAILALTLAVGAIAPLSATSYVMVSDEALVDAAPVAAVVRVVSEDRAAGLRNPAGPSAVTEYVVQVEEALKGQIPGGIGAQAVVRMPGGRGRDGMALRIHGLPRLRTGERALLFLEPAGGGAWRVVHLLLGAFREVEAGGRRLAVRDLSEAREVRRTASGAETAPGSDRLRDFDGFASWVADRALRVRRAADYYVHDADGGLGRAVARFRLFEDPDDGFNLRWFDFDGAGNAKWKAFQNGQAGLAGGGYAEFQAALAAWNAETQTPVDYRYDGKTKDKSGLSEYDEVNSIVFNNAEKFPQMPDFSCGTGGVLAYGGPWYFQETTGFLGKQYHRIANADIVINDGIGCFFADSPSPLKAAMELFAHELGHTLGLNHSCGDNDSPDPDCESADHDEALMRAFIHDDGRGGALNSDDQAGLRALYALDPAPAAPTDLAATVLSDTEVGLSWTDNAGNETAYVVEMRTLGGVFAEVKSLPADSTGTTITGLLPATAYVFRVLAENDSGPSTWSNEVTVSTNGASGPCAADAQTVCLNSGRFRVQVAWKTSAGDEGMATSVPVLSDDSALLWFFNASNWEMLVKVLDGCAVTNSYWVFFAATTDVQFIVTVTDTETGKVRTYFNPQGSAADAVTDTGAFPACP